MFSGICYFMYISEAIFLSVSSYSQGFQANLKTMHQAEALQMLFSSYQCISNILLTLRYLYDNGLY